MAIAVVAALGAYCAACVADKAGRSDAAPKQQESAAANPTPRPATEITGKAAGANPREDQFPLPIWRNRSFDGVHELGGVLLHTTEGTVQIIELTWGADQNGKIYGCFLRAFYREGEQVEFGSPEACTERIVKERFLGSAMTASDDVDVQSFNLATDHEGYLFVADVVLGVEPEGLDTCRLSTVQTCVKKDCTGNCGVPLEEFELLSAKNGGSQSAFVAPIVKEPISCACMGGSGSCKMQWVTECTGTCAESRVCTPFDDMSCECQ